MNFEAFELNTVLRALVNEWMRVMMKPSPADDEYPEPIAFLIRKTHEAILAAESEQVNLDDARAVYDFWQEVDRGESRPAFVE